MSACEMDVRPAGGELTEDWREGGTGGAEEGLARGVGEEDEERRASSASCWRRAGMACPSKRGRGPAERGKLSAGRARDRAGAGRGGVGLTLRDPLWLDLRGAGALVLLGVADEPAGDAEAVWREEAVVVWVCDLPHLAEEEGREVGAGKEGDGEVSGCENSGCQSVVGGERGPRGLTEYAELLGVG